MKPNPMLSLITIVLLIFLLNPYQAFAANAKVTDVKTKIEAFIKSNMKKSDIPGMSVVIVEGNETVFKKGFGYSDTAADKPVTPDTLFELGSTSKAFTALAILQLENEGLLSVNDSVAQHIPWFTMNYEGKPANITISQLLHQTSGIPFKSIGNIPIAEGKDALERTVRTLVGQKLDFKPGNEFLYATINYDVLGLIVQQVSGQTYEDYMKNSILKPLGLNNTYLFRQETAALDMAKGYKFKLLRALEYDAPMYRGNTPAGYFITNAEDMEKWLRIQLGTDAAVNLGKQLIERSHLPDQSVSPSNDGSSYAAGWSSYQRGSGEISHGGNNPNFSSYIVFRPQEGIGVAVLANLNTSYTQTIGQGIIDIIQGKELAEPGSDFYKSLDNTASAIIFITIPFIMIIGWFTFIALRQAISKSRRFDGNGFKVIGSLMIFILFMTGFTYCLYRIPDVLYWGLNWDFVNVWVPQSLIFAVISMFIAVLLFNLYLMFSLFFPKNNDRSLFILIVLSMISGFGNAIIIFMVNEALNRDDGFQSGLLLYFVMGIGIYIFGQKLVRTRLIHIANNMVYEKRTELIEKILNTSYEKMEGLEYGRIQASLNNDTETISDFSNIVISGATSLVTLVCCFIYMGVISFYGLLVSIFVIFIAAGLHFFIGKQANKLWEQTRDIQNIFFKFINDLIGGFKELSMHNGKRKDFKQDMQSSNVTYREKRIKGDMKFANVNVIGELLFTFVIGAVAFLFPVIFPELKMSALRNYVFVLLYMTGPIHSILGTIPNIFRVRISWNRLNELSRELDSIREELSPDVVGSNEFRPLELKLKAVEYHYKNKEGEAFTVGPINYVFRSGEITFITGGNGSGKSTLAKLVTGLYVPDSGEISINGGRVSSEQLGQEYAAIFSDFHLFDKLYGIDYAMKKTEIEQHLKILQIENKVEIKEGALSTIKLSTGQRKRLALLISYLEDRPVYLFDEWAADQDPEFRLFFYDKLLPQLKERGKCIIAITHDDRFFGMADQVIKMEMGKMVTA